ncbi:MAG: FAD-dependent oxidoreductase [Kiritimatiellales bacterium]|nr:FAD-dependent oxidoreductase [Kiritimatiellales bacterium]
MYYFRKKVLHGLIALSNVAWSPAAELLVEAERFSDKGGWVVDQQFTHTVGSPYLLAHGMGKPVPDASTEVEFPATGKYRLWVRTKNWVPGEWDAPGRFKVAVDGTALPPVFGTETDWGWQDGGTIGIAKKKTRISLRDMTSFEGRCDALYFTTDSGFVPPNARDQLQSWRDRLNQVPAIPPSAGDFDVVIVGGGIAGCGAALAAEEQGLKVALIHDRPLLGGNASSEVRVHTLGVYGPVERILKAIDTGHWENGSAEAIPDTEKRHRTLDASSVHQFLEWRAESVAMEGNRIASMDARHIETGKTLRFHAPVFIDCTGDGWIGYWAGADFRYGRESRNEFNEGWEQHGDLWSPDKPDNRVMGSSVLWNSQRLEHETGFPDVPWAMDVAGEMSAIYGEWEWEFSSNELHQIDDAEEIRDHMFRAIYGSFSNAKKNPENAKVALQWVAYIAGKRESRRLMGDYIYTMQDVVQHREFPDTVAEEVRSIDVHYQENLKDKEEDFLSEALFRKAEVYFIPFRCLYSRNIENLMMAGRCFSCSHVGLGGPRVMRTTGQMGIATGYAAALCKKHGTTPRGIYQEHIAELRKLIEQGNSN